MLLTAIPLLFASGIAVMYVERSAGYTALHRFAGVAVTVMPLLLAPLSLLTAIGAFMKSLGRSRPNYQFLAEAGISLVVVAFFALFGFD